MSQSRHTQKRATGAPGVKALIAAASLAATLGGWAALTHTPAETTEAASAPLEPSTALKLDPLPTIIPPPQIAIDRPPAMPAALLHAQAPAVTPPTTQQQAPAPAPAQPALVPPLRVVSAPPQPVARTRSSR